MNIALAYHKGDRDQAVRWMEWVAELGGLGEHKLYTICSYDCDPVPEILPQTSIPDCEKTPGGDWQGSSSARSAAAPNAMFRTFAWHFQMEKSGPWLFVEPDCIPLRSGWHDALETEYMRGGKPFMGAHVLIDRVPPHLTGNSLCPQNVPELAPSLIMRTNWISEGKEYELAFDIAGAKEVLPQASFTNLIQHKFRHPGFKSREEFEATIDPRAVLFHSNKTGDIYPFLRKESFTFISMGAPETASPLGQDVTADSAAIWNKVWEENGYREEYIDLKKRETESATAAPITMQMTGDTSRESLVHDAVAILKQLCTSPVHTGKVRKELKMQGVIR